MMNAKVAAMLAAGINGAISRIVSVQAMRVPTISTVKI